MDNKIKQQVFDVLFKDGIQCLFCNKVHSWTHTVENITDDIETRMLDWLEKNSNNVKIISNHKTVTTTNYSDTYSFFDWDDNKPRPVAVAEACVWVYKELNK